MKRCAWFVMMAIGLSVSARAQIAVGPARRAVPAESVPTAVPTRNETNPFLGSVPAGAASPEPVVLTLSMAVERALQHNLGVLTLEQQVESARGSRWRSLTGLLPSVAVQSGQTFETTNLAAFGFDPSLFPGLPSIVGPFGVFDARVFVSQPLLDLSALNDVRRSAHALDAATFESRNARDVVVLVVTDRYLQTVTAANRIAAVQAQVATAEGLLKLATDLRNAGVTPGIDVVRAKVQLRAQQQRLIVAQNAFAKQKLQLARAIGIPSAQPIELSDTDTTVPRPALTLEQALQRASASRTDYQAALARVRAAESDYRAARTDALPSLHVNADYGALGASPSDARRTYSVSGTVQVPVFDAGRRKSRLIETAAGLRERQAAAADFADRIASDVRSAFLDVQAAEQQLAVSREQVDLANQELGLAQTRFSAGVTSNLEVIQAQDEVATATENEMASAYAFNAAKAALVRTLGSTNSDGHASSNNGDNK
jgi:outer membrane protein TolC